MEQLPDDIKMEIFSRLPPEPVLKCKLVCKTWEKLLSHRKVGLLFLIRSYGKRNAHLYNGSYDDIYSRTNSGAKLPHKTLTKINHPGINWAGSEQIPSDDQIVGSCNGMVCIRVPHHKVLDPVYICNPITMEYIYLPRIKHKMGFIVSGFGYHPSDNKYKVIRIHYPYRLNSDNAKGAVEVYTLGSGTGWRSIGEITYAVSRRGMVANGSLYWLDYGQANIVVFDLLTEEFRVLPTVPQFLDNSRNALYNKSMIRYSRNDLYNKRKIRYYMKVLGGNLCLIHEFYSDISIWSYKNKQENVKEEGYQSWGWSLEYHIPSSIMLVNGPHEPFALSKNNEVLMWVNTMGICCICCYDEKTESLKYLVENDDRLGSCQGIPHMNCHLSMKSLGEKVKSRNYQHKKNKKKSREE